MFDILGPEDKKGDSQWDQTTAHQVTNNSRFQILVLGNRKFEPRSVVHTRK